MEMSAAAPPFELFIVLEPFRGGFGDFVRALEPLTTVTHDGPFLQSSDVYYRADTDVALLAVRFDHRSTTPQKLAWLTSVASRADLPVLDPAKLGNGDRQSFYDVYLPTYRIRVEASTGPRDALEELARLLALPGAPVARATPGNRRGAVGSNPSAVPGTGARTTPGTEPKGRYSVVGNAMRTSDRIPVPSAPARGTSRQRSARTPEAPAPARLVELPARRGRRRAVRAYTIPDGSEGMEASGLARGSISVPTDLSSSTSGVIREPDTETGPDVEFLERTGLHVAPDTDAAATAPLTAESSGSIERPTDRLQALAVAAEQLPAVHVRFLRGDEWAPGRLRSLSLRRARIAAGAPPRVGDRVQLALSLDGMAAVVSGSVSQVTSALEAVDSGQPSGFTIDFGELSTEPRSHLVALLRRAKERQVAIKPPPARAAVRFPIRWPTRVVTPWGEVAASTLNVSKSGLFLSVGTSIGSDEIHFQLPMDIVGAPLSGRARVAREVSDQMAAERGLARGYGLQILDFGRHDQPRYDEFLDRVRRRTEKRLMVAAVDDRASELSRGLTAAGYMVQSGGDVVSLLGVVDGPSRRPDAALIDASLLGDNPVARELRTRLQSLNVPCLTVGDEQPDRARTVVDHLLQIL